MSTNVTEFKPAAAFNPSASFTPTPAAAAKQNFNINTNVFVPSGGNSKPNSMNPGASTFQPVVAAAPPKPVEPAKEKAVLLLERIVKGSETNVKNEDITADDKTKIDTMKESLAEVKKT